MVATDLETADSLELPQVRLGGSEDRRYRTQEFQERRLRTIETHRLEKTLHSRQIAS